MLPRRIIFTRLSDYFVEQGFKPVDESVGDGYIKFRSGKEELILRIVDESYNKDELLATVIQAAFDAASGRIAYVAVPIQLFSKIGDHAFRLHKIGLIVYDRHGVMELVGGKRRESKTIEQEAIEERNRLEAMINSLSSRVSKLEEILDNMGEIDELRRRVTTLEKLYYDLLKEVNTRGHVRAAEAKVEEIEKQQEVGDEKKREQVVKSRKQREETELPSFLRDNPWVSILSEKT